MFPRNHNLLCYFLIVLLSLSLIHCLKSEKSSSGKGREASNKELIKSGKIGVDSQGKMHFSKGDRCPVCAMDVSKHPKFACALVLANGKTFYFCGNGCMIKSWLHPEVYLDRQASELKQAIVQDYFSGDHIDALKAIWIAGSDVVGPMGQALVPLKSERDAITFRNRHGGKTMFHLNEMNDTTWMEITGKPVLPEKKR